MSKKKSFEHEIDTNLYTFLGGIYEQEEII